jgi:serine/threonine protein kinase
MGKEQLGDFFIGKTIGEGAFSKVKLGHHKETGQKVAIKIIDKRMIATIAAKAKIQEERKRLEAEYKKKGKPMKEPVVEVASEVAQPSYLAVIQLEVQLLMRLDHPNVIKLHQMVETDDECYVVM